MVDIYSEAMIWLIGWAFIGATLGFFTIRFNPDWSKGRQIYEYLLSVSVGLFFAVPVFTVLRTYDILDIDLALMASGGFAFFTTDIIINHWGRIVDGVGSLINKVAEKLIGKL